ncbi:hypothetical protein EDD22DRAFT_846221 [Suillus occidentalis]|nr:hypothetical protein EDD22DRAFT_846221 [Suillus occidentalis]
MTAFMQWLDKKELQEAKVKAEKWRNQAPDAAVQVKTVHGRMRRVACSHLDEFFWSSVSCFDFNEQLGKASSFMKVKDWQVILPAWEDFISDAFEDEPDDTKAEASPLTTTKYHQGDQLVPIILGKCIRGHEDQTKASLPAPELIMATPLSAQEQLVGPWKPTEVLNILVNRRQYSNRHYKGQGLTEKSRQWCKRGGQRKCRHPESIHQGRARQLD